MHCTACRCLFTLVAEARTGAKNPRETQFPHSWFCRAVEGVGWTMHGRADAEEHCCVQLDPQLALQGVFKTQTGQNWGLHKQQEGLEGALGGTLG